MAKEVWIKELPWPLKEKGGEDVRDYLLGRPTASPAGRPADRSKAAPPSEMAGTEAE
jgi:hypothetical protein